MVWNPNSPPTRRQQQGERVNLSGKKILVLGGYGLVGMAVCREMLKRRPREIQIHSLRASEAEQARGELLAEAQAAGTALAVSSGDLFGLADGGDRRAAIAAQIGALADDQLPRFLLYRVLTSSRAEVVVDCVNTSTGIAYRDIYRAADRVFVELGARPVSDEAAEGLLEALYMPRLIRHIQVLYRGMQEAGTRTYVKVGTSGTGGMGLNIPYTHSEERPSRVLLSKSALAGAQSMLLFLMARTPGAPITKEIKPAAAIAWKRIGHGPIARRGEVIHLVDAAPQALGESLSTSDPAAARLRDEPLSTVFIDTGENGIFSLEEFALLTTAEQMEFVTPEEIAQYLCFEIEGGNTGHDVINALDNAVLGPTYRAGLLRHWALERMVELEAEHPGQESVAFEMLGPPRNSKLLFEAHLLRLAFGTMQAAREATAEQVRDALDRLVRTQPEVANRVVAVGIPILLDSGELIRGPRVIVPADADRVPVTPERLEAWVADGWVDLRLANCARWVERFRRIHAEIEAIPEGESSSRFLRDRRFWHEGRPMQPGKIVGWILGTEEQGARIKR
ncbi:MAG TPA: short-chain dehydrogenase [Thermoanaerobaculia bacterium]|jgi:nucleoside-diphosphate-sugar epimerase|nr:short-chain dehydrogenase [Thermoanaerobaculia bacterium]